MLIRPAHRGSTLNNILLKLVGVKYPTLINAIPGYHKLKLDKKSPYRTTFSCAFGRFQYIQLSFGVAPVGDMLQKKTDDIFSGMPNVFSIADYVILTGFMEQGRDHDATLDKVLRICRQANFKLNKGKCLFRCISIPFSGEVISQQGVSPDPIKVQALKMPPTKSKKELHLVLGILKYLIKSSPMTAEVCKLLQKTDISEC